MEIVLVYLHSVMPLGNKKGDPLLRKSGMSCKYFMLSEQNPGNKTKQTNKNRQFHLYGILEQIKPVYRSRNQTQWLLLMESVEVATGTGWKGTGRTGGTGNALSGWHRLCAVGQI